jgi:hypothetical protein
MMMMMMMMMMVVTTGGEVLPELPGGAQDQARAV